MKISVITVCYNAASTIADTIDSVASQTWKNVEHLIIDGGSTDGTLDIIRARSDKIARFVSEPDRGIYDAMNKGIGMTTGDVVGFLNSDDVYWDEGVLEEIAGVFATSHVDACFGDLVFVRPDDLTKVVRTYSSRRFSPQNVAKGWMPAHPTLYFTRNVYRKHGLFKINYKIAGDFEIVARVFSDPAIRYRYLRKVLVRMRTGGVSTGGISSTLTLNREVVRACRENGIETGYLKILSKYPAKLLELVTRAK